MAAFKLRQIKKQFHQVEDKIQRDQSKSNKDIIDSRDEVFYLDIQKSQKSDTGHA